MGNRRVSLETVRQVERTRSHSFPQEELGRGCPMQYHINVGDGHQAKAAQDGWNGLIIVSW